MARLLLRRRWWVILPVAVGMAAFPTPDTALTGAAAGLSVGLLAVAVLEYRVTSFSSEEEVSRVLALPVVGTIPEMMPEAERQTRRYRRRIIEVAAGAVTLSVLLWSLLHLHSAGQ